MDSALRGGPDSPAHRAKFTQRIFPTKLGPVLDPVACAHVLWFKVHAGDAVFDTKGVRKDGHDEPEAVGSPAA